MVNTLIKYSFSTNQSAHNINPNSGECGYRDDNYSETEALFSNTNTDVANTMLAKIWMET